MQHFSEISHSKAGMDFLSQLAFPPFYSFMISPQLNVLEEIEVVKTIDVYLNRRMKEPAVAKEV